MQYAIKRQFSPIVVQAVVDASFVRVSAPKQQCIPYLYCWQQCVVHDEVCPGQLLHAYHYFG